MNVYYQSFSTPLGAFTVAANESGALVATAFGHAAALPLPASGASLIEEQERTGPAREQVEAYFEGHRQWFDLALAPQGSLFQQRVWQALQALPYGETTTYGRLALLLGSSPRAVGRANATNPICLIVPCHRVVGSNGGLRGFAYGIDLKQRLLEHERAHAAVSA